MGRGAGSSCVNRLVRYSPQEVAEALDIHPFMLSKWRKQVRDVYVLLIADGRREMQTLLQRRLLGS
jgi:transposase-like protein